MKLEYALCLSPASCSCHATPLLRPLLPFQLHSAGYFEALDGYFTDREGLDSWLLMLTVSGQGSLEYRGSRCGLGAGMLALVNCREPHRYACFRGPWCFWWVHFTGETVGEYDRRIQADSCQEIRVEDLSPWARDFGELLELCDPREVFSDLKASQLIGKLVTDLAILRFAPDNARNGSLHQERIAAVLEYMRQNSQRRITVQEMAEMSFMSPFHFSRIFRAYTGKSPHEYLVHIRINQAKVLLAGGQESVSEIAGRTGFNDANHLIRQFRKTCGTTPLVFRRQHRMG